MNTAAPEMAKRALILVDIQNDYFADGLWPLSNIETATRKAIRALQAFREHGGLVVHIRHEFLSEDAPFFKPDSKGAQLHPDATNLPEETLVLKRHINSFLQTDLKAHLDDNGIREVVVVGNMTHMCVDAVTRAAVDMGYGATVLHDACATRDVEFNGVVVPAEQVHVAFMAALSVAYARVISTDDYLHDMN